MRPEPQFHFLAEQFLKHKLDRALEVGHRHVPVHVQALDLVEGRVVRGVGGVAAVHAARHDDADRRRGLLHHANLHGRRVGAEQRPVGGVQKEGVLRVAGGMIGGSVEGVEAVTLALDLRAVGHGETDFAEAADDVLGDLGEWVLLAKRTAASRRGEVGGALRGGGGELEFLASSVERLGEFGLGQVDRLAGGGAFLLGQAAHLLEQSGELAVGAEVLHAHVVELGQGVGGLQCPQGGFL